MREALPQCVILSSAADNSTRRISLYDRQLPGFDALVGAITKARPAALKGQFFRSVTLTSTMGPGVKLNPTKISG